MKTVTFKIEEDLLEELDAYTIKNETCRSEAIRKAIKMLLQANRKKETVPTAKVEKFKLF